MYSNLYTSVMSNDMSNVIVSLTLSGPGYLMSLMVRGGGGGGVGAGAHMPPSNLEKY